ncbi:MULTISPECIES: hypothetical protein [unclassified Streptomyces]|uniref:hypothetical protein n=1 Tax=unclassified Streptomyces TaxID=2593676 RepID=UPI002E33A36E|nr:MULTISPECIES: hypothetical protein [unclassified Streptomyces]WUC65446.1 hypothetical protein OG861_15030 [Streptomyces sp. NBC_00539]
MSESPERRLPSARTGPTVPYASYLRVYEPLAAFPVAERAHWSGYAKRGDAPTAQDELRRSLSDLVRVPVVGVPAHESGDAFTAERDGVLLVCPWRTRLRGWLALQELEAEFPRPVLDAALPPSARRRAAEEYEAWRERNPDGRPWIRTAVWQVPLRWFVLVADEEREYLPGERLRYRTPMVQARRRLARGLRTLRAAEGYGMLAEGLVEVGSWLEEFHPRSMVELDYGGLLHALPEAALAGDRSARDLAMGIAALRAGDAEGATDAYTDLAERWKAVRERLFAN